MASERDRETPYFDRFCIVFLSLEWIVFGSMHFSFHRETALQIPDYFPWKPTVVIVTGMLEVATGILILVPRFRKWAALSSLILLVLLMPAVYNILANEAALEGSSVWRTTFRLLLLPNNILLALCSIHLWQNPRTSVIEPAEIIDNLLAGRRSARAGARSPPTDVIVPSSWAQPGRATLLVAFLLLASNCAGFLAIWTSRFHDYAMASLWAMACIAIGALIGFLFAVPRVNPAARQLSSLLPNTNVETISDWLTKIIVGLGLVHLREIGMFLDTLSANLASSLGSPSDKPFVLALILYFFVVGLIQGYLLTRMFLTWQFLMLNPNAKATEMKGPIREK